MLTIKIQNERGGENIIPAASVSFIRDYDVGDYPDRLELIGAEGFMLFTVSGKACFGSDRSFSPRCQVFVMNENGATVADYVFARDVEYCGVNEVGGGVPFGNDGAQADPASLAA